MIFPNRKLGALVGVCLLVGGWVCLNDAYVRRNVKPPMPLRPFMWWR